jgi:hypothetical protein
MDWVFDDGGRKKAGYQGFTGDCGVRAVAIATGRPYQEIYDEVVALGKKERTRYRKYTNPKTGFRARAAMDKSHPRTGIYHTTMRRWLEGMGWIWCPTMGIGTGCTIHLRDGELPTGRLIVSLSKHYAAVINGVIHDIGDPSRDGTRCVYGYWEPGTESPEWSL